MKKIAIPDYQDALTLHRQGNLDAAEAAYQKFLRKHPNNTEVLHLLSILYAQKKDYATAKSYIEKALKEQSDSPTLYNSQGNILLNLEDYAGAIAAYQKAFALDPTSATSLNNIANIYFRQKNWDAAEKTYTQALAIKPDYADAHYNLALSLAQKNSLDAATSELRACIKVEPKHAEAHAKLAQILQLNNKPDEAIPHYHITLKNHPEDIQSHHNLAVILIGKQKYGAAIRHLKKVLALNPNHQEALHNIGSIFLLQKNPHSALKYFLHLATLLHDFDTFYNLGVVYQQIQRYRDAIYYFLRSLECDPISVPSHTNLAAIYLKLEDYPNAEKQYEKILAIEPNNQEATYLLSALKQQDLTTAPKEYVASLFDSYAEHYEEHLKLLDYKVPELIAKAIAQLPSLPCHPSGSKVSESTTTRPCTTILDLGCGTGLTGIKLRPFASKLIGIDLSDKMLEIARSKHIYDELKHCSIDEALQNYRNLDMIVAADTFVYIGDLNDVFAAGITALIQNGLLVFTVEKTYHYPYLLQKTARFCHSAKYIVELAQKYTYSIALQENIILRKQKDTIIEGYLFVLKK